MRESKMKKGDVLLKKWCFGISYKKIYDRIEIHDGKAQVVASYPKYRSIALRVVKAKKKGKNTWEIEAERFASMTAKPKTVKLVIKKTKTGTFAIDGQKKVYHKLKKSTVLDEKLPPVGSLVTLNKRHALVCAVGRNEMTIFLDGHYNTVSVKPGTVRWREDNILASIPKL